MVIPQQGSYIELFCRAEETTFDHKEREKFNQFCACYGLNLVPYINKCMQALFPPAQLAQILGVMVSDVYKMVIMILYTA